MGWFNRMLGLEEPKKSRWNNGDYSFLDYSPLLNLLNEPHVPDKEYSSFCYGASNIKEIKHEFALTGWESDCFWFCGRHEDYERGYIYQEEVTSFLTEKILPILEEFYNKHKDDFVVFYPADTIEHCNTVSQGWYLFYDTGTKILSLECRYRAFTEKGE